jgi:hypothetical protein
MVYLGSEYGLGEEVVGILLEILDRLFLDNHRLDSLPLHLLDCLCRILDNLFEHENKTSIRQRDIRTRDHEEIGKVVDGKRVVRTRPIFPFFVQIDAIATDEGRIF